MKQTDPPPAANAGSTTPHTHTHTPIHTHTMRGCGLRAALRTRTRTRTRTHTLTHGGKQTRSPVHVSGCRYPDARVVSRSAHCRRRTLSDLLHRPSSLGTG